MNIYIPTYMYIYHNDHERKTNSFDVYTSETIITVSDTQIHTPYP